ncbi:AraC family transcriptional regulator [bacterium]|nr:MAG: AraC family transcriptional regulator [bacterium]
MTIRETLGRYRLEVGTRGTIRFDVQPSNSLHRHDFTEICLVTGGSGRYRHGEGEYRLRPGDTFVADPGVPHEISSHLTRDLELWFLTLSVQRLDVATPTLEDEVVERYLGHHRTHVEGQQSLARYLPLIEEQAQGLDRLAAGMAARYLALGMLQALSEAPPSARETPTSDPVDLALAYIESRLDRPLSVDEVAAAVGLSSRSLRRRFQARLQVGIAEETNHRRMRRAAHLLLMGFGAAEAGRQVGIDEPAQFSRAFRRAMGVGPKAFQASYLSEGPGRITRP